MITAYRARQRAPTMAESHPALFRLQSAHSNTFECLAMLTACFCVGTVHPLDPVLFAKLAIFALASRMFYVLAYVLDEDFLRTGFFIFGVTAITDVGIGAIFPGALAKYA